jgi:hypothetical protein
MRVRILICQRIRHGLKVSGQLPVPFVHTPYNSRKQGWDESFYPVKPSGALG